MPKPFMLTKMSIKGMAVDWAQNLLTMIRSLHFLSITYLNNLPVVLFCYLASNAIILLGYSFYVLLSYPMAPVNAQAAVLH